MSQRHAARKANWQRFTLGHFQKRDLGKRDIWVFKMACCSRFNYDTDTWLLVRTGMDMSASAKSSVLNIGLWDNGIGQQGADISHYYKNARSFHQFFWCNSTWKINFLQKFRRVWCKHRKWKIEIFIPLVSSGYNT